MNLTKICLIGILFGCSATAQSQHMSFPFFGNLYNEDAPVSIGFQYSYLMSSYRLTLQPDWQQQSVRYPGDNINNIDQLKGISSSTGIGVSIGLPIDVKLHKKLFFSTAPSFLFVNTTRIQYENETGEKNQLGYSANFFHNSSGSNFNAIDLPISIKFKSDEKYNRQTNTRYKGYLIGGINWRRHLDQNKEYNTLIKDDYRVPDPIVLHTEILSWEAGLGFEWYFAYFKCSPEIKFSQSFRSVLNKNHPLNHNSATPDGLNQLMTPLDKALLRNIKFSLIFQ